MLKKLIFPKILQRLEETRYGRAMFKRLSMDWRYVFKRFCTNSAHPISVENFIILFWLVECPGSAYLRFPANKKMFKLDVLLQPLISLLWFFMKSPCHTPSAGSSSILLICLYFRLVSNRNKPHLMEWIPAVSFLSSALCTASQGPLSQAPQWPPTVWG